MVAGQGESMLTIVMWKWKPEPGAKHEVKRSGFSAKHVNSLASGIARHTTMPLRYVCVTDDPKGIKPGIQTIDINTEFSEFSELGGCYRRLGAFDRDKSRRLFGDRFICIDLDCVVVGPLNHLLNKAFNQDFVIWKDTYRRRAPYCGALWGMEAGTRQHVLATFRTSPQEIITAAREAGYIGTDQAVFNYLLGRNECTWGVDDGVLNFNTRVRPAGGKLPEDARLVFFNGKYDPAQPQLLARYSWIKEGWG